MSAFDSRRGGASPDRSRDRRIRRKWRLGVARLGVAARVPRSSPRARTHVGTTRTSTSSTWTTGRRQADQPRARSRSNRRGRRRATSPSAPRTATTVLLAALLRGPERPAQPGAGHRQRRRPPVPARPGRRTDAASRPSALGRGIYSVSQDRPRDSPPHHGRVGRGAGLVAARRLDRLRQAASATANYDIFAVNAAHAAGAPADERLAAADQSHLVPGRQSRFAFAEQQTNGKWAIVTMRTDGTGRRRVTGKRHQRPGARLVARRQADRVRQAGAGQGIDRGRAGERVGPARTLTDKRFFPSKPAWSPDGKSIAFAATAGRAG